MAGGSVHRKAANEFLAAAQAAATEKKRAAAAAGNSDVAAGMIGGVAEDAEGGGMVGGAEAAALVYSRAYAGMIVGDIEREKKLQRMGWREWLRRHEAKGVQWSDEVVGLYAARLEQQTPFKRPSDLFRGRILVAHAEGAKTGRGGREAAAAAAVAAARLGLGIDEVARQRERQRLTLAQVEEVLLAASMRSEHAEALLRVLFPEVENTRPILTKLDEWGVCDDAASPSITEDAEDNVATSGFTGLTMQHEMMEEPPMLGRETDAWGWTIHSLQAPFSIDSVIVPRGEPDSAGPPFFDRGLALELCLWLYGERHMRLFDGPGCHAPNGGYNAAVLDPTPDMIAQADAAELAAARSMPGGGSQSGFQFADMVLQRSGAGDNSDANDEDANNDNNDIEEKRSGGGSVSKAIASAPDGKASSTARENDGSGNQNGHAGHAADAATAATAAAAAAEHYRDVDATIDDEDGEGEGVSGQAGQSKHALRALQLRAALVDSASAVETLLFILSHLCVPDPTDAEYFGSETLGEDGRSRKSLDRWNEGAPTREHLCSDSNPRRAEFLAFVALKALARLLRPLNESTVHATSVRNARRRVFRYCGGDGEADRAAPDGAQILVNTVRRMGLRSPHICTAVCTVWCLLAYDRAGHEHLQAANVCAVLVENMLRPHADVHILTGYVLLTMYRLASPDKLDQFAHVQAPVALLDCVVRPYLGTHPEKLVSACIVASLLCNEHEPNQIMFGDSGACDAFVSVLNTHGPKNAQCAQVACETIRHLAYQEGNRRMLGQAGACAAVVDSALRHFGATHTAVAEQGCWAVANLAASFEPNQAMLGEAGACEVIAEQTMASDVVENPAVAEHACEALSHLTANHEGNRTRLAKTNICEVLVKRLLPIAAKNAAVAETCCLVIVAMCRAQGCAERFGKAGACDAIIKCALKPHARDNVTVAEWSVAAVFNLAERNRSNKRRLRRAGIVEELTSLAPHFMQIDTVKVVISNTIQLLA